MEIILETSSWVPAFNLIAPQVPHKSFCCYCCSQTILFKMGIWLCVPISSHMQLKVLWCYSVKTNSTTPTPFSSVLPCHTAADSIASFPHPFFCSPTMLDFQTCSAHGPVFPPFKAQLMPNHPSAIRWHTLSSMKPSLNILINVPMRGSHGINLSFSGICHNCNFLKHWFVWLTG